MKKVVDSEESSEDEEDYITRKAEPVDTQKRNKNSEKTEVASARKKHKEDFLLQELQSFFGP